MIFLKQITNDIMKQILTSIFVCFVAIAAMHRPLTLRSVTITSISIAQAKNKIIR